MKIPSDTLYLPIRQKFFDEIIAGTKKIEYREIKEGITMGRYLIKEKNLSGYRLDPKHTDPARQYFYNDYNGGHYPFVPKPYKYLYLAVGYAKDRDTAKVEITGFSFHPEQILRDRDNRPCFCWWIMEIHLGRVTDIHRK